MLTKAELEDIWNNKPVGYLKNKYLRRGKLPKKYVVEITPRQTETITHNKLVYEVSAHTQSEATTNVSTIVEKYWKGIGVQRTTNLKLDYIVMVKEKRA